MAEKKLTVEKLLKGFAAVDMKVQFLPIRSSSKHEKPFTAGSIGLDKIVEAVNAALLAEPAAEPAPAAPTEPQRMPITKPGQVKAGTKLRFTIGDKPYNETAKAILDAGTDREEIIYNKRQNYSLITSMAIKNQGSQKNVAYLALPQKKVTQ